jgi:hypothetical protein
MAINNRFSHVSIFVFIICSSLKTWGITGYWVVTLQEVWNLNIFTLLKWVRHFYSYRIKCHERNFLAGGEELPAPRLKLYTIVL